ncbi:MAG: sterol desaturase family protein [Acidimicrobiales bacterium]
MSAIVPPSYPSRQPTGPQPDSPPRPPFVATASAGMYSPPGPASAALPPPPHWPPPPGPQPALMAPPYPGNPIPSAPVPVGGSRLKRVVLSLIALGLIAGSLAIDRGGFAVVPLLFILVVPFEKMFPRHSQKIRRPQVGTDIGYALAGPLLSGIGLAAAVVVAVVSLAWLPGLAVRPLVGLIPPAIAPLVGIALFDLAIYWTHRWYHEVPILWRFHAIHHSPDHMDWISGFRNHPFDGTLIAPAFVFLLAAGFSAEFTGVLAVVQFVLGIFLHANVRWRLRPLHRLVITPEFHHWHHANEPGAINSNYSVFLPAWDLIFGTYFMPRHRRPQVYGVTEYVPPGMVAQLWHPMRGMGNPLRLIRHPIRSIKGGFRFTRRLLGEMKQSAMRPRRRSHDQIDLPGAPAPARSSSPPSAPDRSFPAESFPADAFSAQSFPPPDPPTGPEPSVYSPYFTVPAGATSRTAGGPPTAVMPGSAPTEVYLEPKSLAEVMRWDDGGYRPAGWQ